MSYQKFSKFEEQLVIVTINYFLLKNGMVMSHLTTVFLNVFEDQNGIYAYLHCLADTFSRM